MSPDRGPQGQPSVQLTIYFNGSAHLAQIHRQSPHERYRLNLERALIVALLLVLILFNSLPKIKQRAGVKREGYGLTIVVEDIPVTRQIGARQPPPRPVVPIPSEDELIPADVTIEDTELTFDATSLSAGSGGRPAMPSLQPDIIQPRPIYEVIPEYSEELQKKGIEGMVKLHLHIDKFGRVIEVVELQNTTGSPVCGNAAREAALKGRYIPAKRDGEPADIWITRTYSFGLKK